MKKFLSIVDVGFGSADQVGVVSAATPKIAIDKTLEKVGLGKSARRFVHVYEVDELQEFWYFGEE